VPNCTKELKGRLTKTKPNTMIGYKLMRKRRDGTLGPLFINRSMTVPVGKWMWAKENPTPGFAVRKGWHACVTPEAPHLAKGDDRVWCKVELYGYRFFERPAAQGGRWILANRMRVLEEIG